MSVEYAVKRFHRSSHDVRETKQRDQVRQQSNNEEVHVLVRSEDPNERGDDPARADAFREHLKRRVGHKAVHHVRELSGNIGPYERKPPQEQRKHKTANKVGGQHDAPKPQHTGEPIHLAPGDDWQNGSEHVLGEQLLPPEDYHQEAYGISKLGNDRPPL